MQKICSRGHVFQKSSSCPVCPKCWPGYKKKLQSDFPEKLSAPALRALQRKKIKNLSMLAKCSEGEVRNLHGIGPKALKALQSALRSRKMSFRK